MKEHKPFADDFEARLRQVRVAEPPAALRQRLLAGARQQPESWWGWHSWRFEMAVGAAILVCLTILASFGVGPPATPRIDPSTLEDPAVTDSLNLAPHLAKYLISQVRWNRQILELEENPPWS